jgi:diaminopropionate ammonia-lyase
MVLLGGFDGERELRRCPAIMMGQAEMSMFLGTFSEMRNKSERWLSFEVKREISLFLDYFVNIKEISKGSTDKAMQEAGSLLRCDFIDFALKLENYGAEVVYSGETYEQSCQAAIEYSKCSDDVLLADSAWIGYVESPMLIMEGYTIIAEELREKFESNNNWPTHVFVQAGVGGLAGSLTHMIRMNWKKQPKIIVIEPEAAPCLLESAKRAFPVTVTGPLSNMGRLDCKVPSLIALKILSKSDVEYLTISDDEAENATKILADNKVHTTPSGAAGFAGLKKYNLPINAQPLVIITEGVLS